MEIKSGVVAYRDLKRVEYEFWDLYSRKYKIISLEKKKKDGLYIYTFLYLIEGENEPEWRG